MHGVGTGLSHKGISSNIIEATLLLFQP